MNNTILFLDFDGVMITEYGKRVNQDDGSGQDEFGPIFDSNAEDTLDAIMDQVHFEIVVTSNRRYVGLKQLHLMWEKRQLESYIIDITPLHAADEAIAQGETNPGKIKAIEIKAWLKNHPDVKHYAIVDDEPIDDVDLQPHFIQCDSELGICNVEYYIVKVLQGFYHTSMLPPKDFSLLGCPKIAKLPAIGLPLSTNDMIEKVMENVVLIAEKGDNRQVALAYGLAMLITMQTRLSYVHYRYDELLGLLCNIAIDLKEVEMAKMLMRIIEGNKEVKRMLEDYKEEMQEEFIELSKAIDAISPEEAVDNRLVYFELICELRRHWLNDFMQIHY